MSPIVRKKGEKFKLTSQYWLLILTLVCCGLIILSFNTSVFKGPLDFIANYLIVPFQNGVSVVGMQSKAASIKANAFLNFFIEPSCLLSIPLLFCAFLDNRNNVFSMFLVAYYCYYCYCYGCTD